MKIKYIPQNTGWSGGNDWFDTDPYTTYTSRKSAFSKNRMHKEEMNDPDILYRVIKETTIIEIIKE